MQSANTAEAGLPWNLEGSVGWVVPTKRCDLYCEGCSARFDQTSDRSLDEIRADLAAWLAGREVEALPIAGGDPMVHPQIVDIVRMVREEHGLKPVVHTHGQSLDEARLRDLVAAGLHGFTFHIDAGQGRPGWSRATDRELGALRADLARRVRAAGDLFVAFEVTVHADSVDAVEDLIRWARENADSVDAMVFVLVGAARNDARIRRRTGRLETAARWLVDLVTRGRRARGPAVLFVEREGEPGADCEHHGAVHEGVFPHCEKSMVPPPSPDVQ